MTKLVLASMLAIALAFTACGGPAKPPMVPDDSTLGDGGMETTVGTPPAPLVPANPK